MTTLFGALAVAASALADLGDATPRIVLQSEEP
jgi:hypothetical protein